MLVVIQCWEVEFEDSETLTWTRRLSSHKSEKKKNGKPALPEHHNKTKTAIPFQWSDNLKKLL